jgi:hypothetical protein
MELIAMDACPLLRSVRRSLLILAAIVSLSLSGCTGALFTAMWLVRGNDVPAEFKGLKDKKVAVVCRPLVGLSYREAGVSQEIATKVDQNLRANVRNVELIEQRKIAEWTDENTWDEYTEIGKALGADLVIGIDLEEFNLYKGQTVYEGRASVLLKVYDCKTGQVVFEKHMPPVVYPPNSPKPVAEQPESSFTREYVAVLSEHIARYFYPHDPYSGFAVDATTLTK